MEIRNRGLQPPFIKMLQQFAENRLITLSFPGMGLFVSSKTVSSYWGHSYEIMVMPRPVPLSKSSLSVENGILEDIGG